MSWHTTRSVRQRQVIFARTLLLPRSSHQSLVVAVASHGRMQCHDADHMFRVYTTEYICKHFVRGMNGCVLCPYYCREGRSRATATKKLATSAARTNTSSTPRNGQIAMPGRRLAGLDHGEKSIDTRVAIRTGEEEKM